MHQYTLRLTETQARTLVRATDLFMRTQAGQLHILIEQLKFRPNINLSSEAMDAIDARLNQIKALLFPELGGHPGASNSMSSPQNSEGSRIAYDIHQVLRHRLAWDEEAESKKPHTGFHGVWHDTPRQCSREPLPQISSENPCACKDPLCSGVTE